MKVQVKRAVRLRFAVRRSWSVISKIPGSSQGRRIQLDRSSGGLLGEVIKSGDFTGKHAQVSVIYTRGALPARRVLLLGLGKKKEFDPEKLRRAFSKAARTPSGSWVFPGLPPPWIRWTGPAAWKT